MPPTLKKLNTHQYFNLEKKLNRQQYAKSLLFTSLAMLILLLLWIFSFGQGFVLFLVENKDESGWFSSFSFIALYACLALTIIAYLVAIIMLSLQRLNDLSLSKCWILLCFIPFIDLVFILFLLLMPKAKTVSNHEVFK